MNPTNRERFALESILHHAAAMVSVQKNEYDRDRDFTLWLSTNDRHEATRAHLASIVNACVDENVEPMDLLCKSFRENYRAIIQPLADARREWLVANGFRPGPLPALATVPADPLDSPDPFDPQ